MKKILTMAFLMILSGCGVKASCDLTSYSAVVVNSDDTGTTVMIKEPYADTEDAEDEEEVNEDTEEESDYKHGDIVEISSDDLMIIDGDRSVSSSSLAKDEEIIVTFRHPHAVIHTVRGDKTEENGKDSDIRK